MSNSPRRRRRIHHEIGTIVQMLSAVGFHMVVVPPGETHAIEPPRDPHPSTGAGRRRQAAVRRRHSKPH